MQEPTEQPLLSGLTVIVVEDDYGIAERVKIYSEPVEGTTMKIYLPRLHAVERVWDREERPAAVRGTGETILVVEDDDDVRASTTEMLRDLGY